jgi:hypothetical protein
MADRIRLGTQPVGAGGSEPGVLNELEQLRNDVTELQERMDFAERMISSKGTGQLPQGGGPS